MRWIDLSAYGMRLFVAVLPTTRALVMDNVPDDLHNAVTALGFKKRDTGAYVKAGPIDVNPREYLRLLPKAKIREMEQSEYLIHLDKSAAQKDSGASVVAAASDIPEAVPLGFNRLGQKVFEEDGRRHIVDSKGRRIREDQVGTAMPGMFLRAIDDGSLAMCAEGFIETVTSAKGEDFSEPAAFMKTLGLGEADRRRFGSEVAEAVVRYVVKKGGLSLRDRYGKALEIRKGLAGFSLGEIDNFDNAVIAKRLMGMDKDLVGAAVFQAGGDQRVLDGLLPRGVRKADKIKDADVCVSFPASRGEALAVLSSRPQGSLTVSFVPVMDAGEARKAAEDISKAAAVEAAAYVDVGTGSRFLVATSLAGEPVPARSLQEISDDGELWSWASLVATERSRAAEAVKSGLATDADFNAGDPSLGRNSHQVPYKSAAKSGTPLTMVPKELEAPTRQALDRIISNFGDVDARVAVECGFPRDELGEILSPEQIDAVALAIHAEERNRGFLLADNTGVGKGRANAALAKRAVLQNRKVLVLTEKASNLSDLMRDVKHIRALDVIRPAVMNKDVGLIDEATGEPFETADQNVLYDAIEKGVWPEGIDVVYATYSQFNKPKDESKRSAWLHSAIGDDVVVLADEVHNAASGDSNTSENVAAAIEAAGSIVWSSATFAGNAKMMSFFERLFPEGMSGAEIAAMMRKGGEQFQEVVSAMLVADGVMIRREKDLSSLEISQHLNEEMLPRNREYMDALAAVIGEMAMLSGELNNVITDHNRNQANLLKGLQMKRIGFGSPLYRMTRLFTAALLAEDAADRAVAALRNGEKPVVLVESTIQGVLDDAAANGGDAPMFKDVVRRVLEQMTKMTVVNIEGEAARVDAGDDNRGIADAVAHISSMIDSLPDLPASAIDVVKNRIAAEGYSCREITGRTLEVVNGKVVPRTNRDATANKNSFNSGETDAIIINASGSTGIDLHASARFKDQRRRVMIELQGPAHVLKQIQAFGRISRYDEVVPSRIEVLSTGLPAEVRLAAMRNQKLRRLSANVTSNRDSVYLARNIPDLINSVGDAVITRYAEMRPDLMKRLCLADSAEEDGQEEGAAAEEDINENQRDNNRSANEFLSRLMLLPTEHQEKVLAELTAEYELHVAELEARGENPLRPRELDGIVHIRSNRLFEGSASAGALTAFDGPMHMLDVSVERVAEPIRAEEVMAKVEEGTAEYGKVKKAAASLQRNRDRYLEPFLPKKARNVEEALVQGSKKIGQMMTNMRDLGVALECLAPGRELDLNWGDGETETAIITAIWAPPHGFEHLPHMYKVDLAVPGATRISSFRLDSIIHQFGLAKRDGDGCLAFNVKEGLEGSDYDAVLDKFENAVARKFTSGRILTTNIFRAVRMATQHNLGSLVSFVDAEGNRHRGVLVKRGFEKRLDMLSIRIDGVDQAMRALCEVGAEINSSSSGSKNSILISPVTSSSWLLKLPLPPRRKGRANWPTPAYEALYGRGVAGDNGRVRLTLDGEDDLRNALEVLYDAGVSAFYVNPKHRDKFAEETERQMELAGMRS